jgi:cytochrome c biogenesis protein ResB
VLEVQLFVGDLGLDNGASQDVFSLTVSFPDLRQFSLFHVKKDNGVPLVYTAFVLTMVGLLTKLYLRPFLERTRKRRTTILRPAGAATSTLEEPPPHPVREEALTR